MKRILEIIIGLLFITATLSYMFGSSLIVESPQIGIILEMINNISVLLIGYFFFQLTKNINRKLGFHYLLARAFEAICLTIGTWSVLSASMTLYMIMFPLAMIVLGIYSSYFFYKLYAIDLGPKYLNIIGVIGYVFLTLYSLLNLIGISDDWTMILFLPGAIFELAFPLYLIFKGYPKNKLA